MKRAKEELKDVARQLGLPVQTYHYWLNKVDVCDLKNLEAVVEVARKYAKREEWSTGNLETFKKHVEDRRKEKK